jgi:hypothetical protein
MQGVQRESNLCVHGSLKKGDVDSEAPFLRGLGDRV